MPSPNCYWLVASPRDDSESNMLQELKNKLDPSSTALHVPGTSASVSVPKISLEKSGGTAVGAVTVPEFKTATLSSLLNLSEQLAKHDNVFVGVLAKIVETIRQLDPNQIEQNTHMDDDRTFEQYLLDGWQWNRAKYRADGIPLEDLVEGFSKDMAGIDAIHKQKQGNYNLARGQLQTLLRKQTGNLATRDLSTVIDKDDVPGLVRDSEYLQVVYVAVPKNSAKEWESKYERLAPMVVPRSSVRVASDDEYILVTATVFKKHKDEFSQKCRENKFTLRDFTYDQAAIEKQQKDIEQLKASERDLWSELLRISRINFSEGMELLVHLKIVRAYVESLLRYGLPASYFYAFLKPDPRQVKKMLPNLVSYFAPFTPKQTLDKRKKGGQIDESMLGEFASVMEAEMFDFVLFEVPFAMDIDSRGT